MPAFLEKIKRVSNVHNSNIVLALDLIDQDRINLSKKSFKILEEVAPYICALKLNRPLILQLGLEKEIKNLIKSAHDLGLMTIMDAKLNDVAHTNLEIAKQYYAAGFDALIASPFVGWDGGLDSTFEEASKRDKGIILLVYMSHRAAVDGYGQTIIDSKTGEKKSQFIIFSERAVNWNADGVVVGATHTDKISEVKAILQGKIPIYSPGVISQGGSPVDSVKAGADYLIVGRAIFNAEDPATAARSIRDEVQSVRRKH